MKFYAYPYSSEASPFFFKTTKQFNMMMEYLEDILESKIDDYRIDFISGSQEEENLFYEMDVNKDNFMDFIERSKKIAELK